MLAACSDANSAQTSQFVGTWQCAPPDKTANQLETCFNVGNLL